MKKLIYFSKKRSPKTNFLSAYAKDHGLTHGVPFCSSGFSLVEVVVASLLLAIVTAGLFSITLSSRKIIERTHTRHSAYEVAQTVFERLRVYLDYNQWYNTSSPIHPTPTVGWRWYSLTGPGSNDPLGISNFYGSSELATRYGGMWGYIVSNGTGCGGGGGGCDYRNVTVQVNWTKDVF